jgi:hypothetical protein
VGIRPAGAAFLRCDRLGITPCDLTEALAGITSLECRDAVECQMNELHALVGTGDTSCVEQLFRQGYRYMVKKTLRIERDAFDRIPIDPRELRRARRLALRRPDRSRR